MTRTTRSGAKSGPSSPGRTSIRRRQVIASTSRIARISNSIEEDEEDIEEAANHKSQLEAPLNQLSVEEKSSKVNLAQCGACLDWFHWDSPPQSSGQDQDIQPIATIPLEHSHHQRLSKLGGFGFVFEPCRKGLCSGINDAKTGLSLVPMSCAECRNLSNKPECVTSDQMQVVLSDTEWNEYQRQLIIGTFQKKFFCPHPDCSAVFDAEDAQMDSHWDQPDTTQVACPECKKTACVECGCPWHTGFNCDEFKSRPLFIRDKEDELVMELATSKQWRRCPAKGCGHTVELELGCNHITCICGKEWCYLCLADWTTIKNAQGEITAQYCARKDKGGPKCPLYTEDSILGDRGQGFRHQRHSMDWVAQDRGSVPYQKANTFTRHLLASRKCGYCDVQFKTKKKLIAHLETTTHDVFDCCAKFFKTREAFDAHVAHSHPSRQWVPGETALRVRRL